MYDVIIVGSGTVGLTAANLLANLGLKICLLEKQNNIGTVSKAVGVNDECLLSWQLCGIWDKISNYIGYNKNGDVILKYLDSNKREILALHQHSGINSFPKGVVLLQSKIDEVLLQNLAGKIEINFGEELLDIEQDSEGVTAKTDRKTYRAKYLLAADGKEGATRRILNIANKELSRSKDEWLVLNLQVENRVITKEFVEVFCGSERSVVSCLLPCNMHRLEISLRDDEKEILQDEIKIRQIVESYVELGTYQIIDKFKIRFVTAIAKKYYVNRVALCGDAAHSTSPFASAGLVSGIRDCLVLYEIFKDGNVDFARYQRLRYTRQLDSLHLAMKLEKVMRPNKFAERLLFGVMRLLGKSRIFTNYISIRS